MTAHFAAPRSVRPIAPQRRRFPQTPSIVPDVLLDSLVSLSEPVILLLVAGSTLVATLRLVPDRQGAGSADLLLFLWSSIGWSACSLTENLPLPADTRLVFGNLAWFGIVMAPLSACLLLWSSSFGHRRPVSPVLRVGMVLVSLAVCLVAFANPGQSMYAQIIVAPDNRGPLRYVHGPFFYLTVSLIYLTVLATMAVTAWAQRHLSWRRRRTHAGLILGISVPLITSGFYASGSLVLFDYDPTPFTFLFTAPLLAWLLAYSGLCDPLPIARRTLLEVLSDAVIILDNDGRVVELNRAARRLSQMPPAPIGALASSLAAWQPSIARAMAAPQEVVQVHLPLNPSRYFEMTATPLDDSGTVAGHLLLVREVTLRQETENRLQAALEMQNLQLADNQRLQAELHGEARIDALTGAYNRRSLEEALPVLVNEALQSKRPISVAMIDLDHFKAINDQYGHGFGDSVLKAFATHLRAMTRKDDMLYRIGGEEFLLVLPGTSQQDAADVLGRWLLSLGKGFLIEGRQLTLGFSAGINTLPGPESDASLLLAHADTAAYVAKRRGRNQVVCYENGLRNADAGGHPG
ncbi:diguanylate cyclase [Xylophilus sp. Kf1]|nr:diguanylate cyclase [Xylophilus sp. Kf1]